MNILLILIVGILEGASYLGIGEITTTGYTVISLTTLLVSVVMTSLVDSDIPYPKKKGKIVYIVESCRHKKPTGLRFSQHIASQPNGARGGNINYTLHMYYWNGVKLLLDIYDVGDVTKDERKEIERDLINAHIKIYGAPPIAQGTSGMLVDDMDKVDETKVEGYF